MEPQQENSNMEHATQARPIGRNGLRSAASLFVVLFMAGTAQFAAAQSNASEAQSNTSLGTGALSKNATGTEDTAIGFNALITNDVGVLNTATGVEALSKNTSGCHNTAAGVQSLTKNTTGSYNIAIGYNAGGNLTTGDNNIDIGNPGVAGEKDTIRIGTQGAQSRTMIAGINGSRLPSGASVLVDSDGRLGIEASSARYKRDIHDMGKASDGLMKLRPVTFRYKEDPSGTMRYGLVAEEVARVYPALVVYGADGKPESVAYHELPAMLLNEVQKQAAENQRKDAQIAALQRQLAAQQQQVSTLQREMSRVEKFAARPAAFHARRVESN
jgi:hypothetical protein